MERLSAWLQPHENLFREEFRLAIRPRLTTRVHALAFGASVLFADAMADGFIDEDERALIGAALADTVTVARAAADTEALTFALARGIETPARFDQLVSAARSSLDEMPSYAAD